MKQKLGLFGTRNIDIYDDVYLRYPIQVNGRDFLTALFIAVDVFEFIENIEKLNDILSAEVIERLDYDARNYLKLALEDKQSILHTFIQHHFNEIAELLLHYHHIKTKQEFLNQLMLIKIAIQYQEHIIIQLYYSIDEQLSDESLVLSYDIFGNLHTFTIQAE